MFPFPVLPKMYTFLKQDYSVEESVVVSAWPQLTQPWCVFLRFAVQGSLCPRRHWEWQQGLHNQVHATKHACHLPLQWKYLCSTIYPSQNGSISGYQPFLWSHLAWKVHPFHSPFSENIHLCDSYHLKRFVALLSDFFFLHRVVILLLNAK